MMVGLSLGQVRIGYAEKANIESPSIGVIR